MSSTNPYSLPEWKALLAAVLASPKDDLPRLVAADWLEEHGESDRAEFIRIQCELHTTRGLKRDRRKPLDRQELKLWRGGVRQQFIFRVPGFTETHSQIDPIFYSMMGGVVRRGFVAEFRGGFQWWYGRQCRRCRGSGSRRDGMVCRLCRGRGMKPGLGVVIANEQPVEWVGVNGKWPLESVFENTPPEERYGWVESDGTDPSSLPSVVFRRLDRASEGSDWAGYSSFHDASRALSDAMIEAVRPASSSNLPTDTSVRAD